MLNRFPASITIRLAAVGADPGDVITRDAPEVFVHAALAHLETAPAAPEKSLLNVAQ